MGVMGVEPTPKGPTQGKPPKGGASSVDITPGGPTPEPPTPPKEKSPKKSKIKEPLSKKENPIVPVLKFD